MILNNPETDQSYHHYHQGDADPFDVEAQNPISVAASLPISKTKKFISIIMMVITCLAVIIMYSTSDMIFEQIFVRTLLSSSPKASSASDRKELITKLTQEKKIAELEKKIEALKKEKTISAKPKPVTSRINFQADDNAHKPSRIDISAPDMGNGFRFGGDSKTIIIVDDLDDDHKRYLFGGVRRVLFGRLRNINNNQFLTSKYKLFELKDEINWENVVIPTVAKYVDIFESYNAKQAAFTKSSYHDLQIQANIETCSVGVGFSFGNSHFEQKQNTETESGYYLTAESFISKGRLIVDEDSVQYTKQFMEDLEQILSTQIDDNDASKMQAYEEWLKFINKYGEYYISDCVIGGSAYSTKQTKLKDIQSRDTFKDEFISSFEVALAGVSFGKQFTAGSTRDNSDRETKKTSAITLNAHGGVSSSCSLNDFSKWESSVDSDYKLWDVIQTLDVKPFEYLLAQDLKTSVQEYRKKMNDIRINALQQRIKYDFDDGSIIHMTIALNPADSDDILRGTHPIVRDYDRDARQMYQGIPWGSMSNYAALSTTTQQRETVFFRHNEGSNLYKIALIQNLGNGEDDQYHFLAVHGSMNTDIRDSNSFYVMTTPHERFAGIWRIKDAGNGNYYIYSHGHVKSEWKTGFGYTLGANTKHAKDTTSSEKDGQSYKYYGIHVAKEGDGPVTQWKLLDTHSQHGYIKDVSSGKYVSVIGQRGDLVLSDKKPQPFVYYKNKKIIQEFHGEKMVLPKANINPSDNTGLQMVERSQFPERIEPSWTILDDGRIQFKYKDNPATFWSCTGPTSTEIVLHSDPSKASQFVIGQYPKAQW